MILETIKLVKDKKARIELSLLFIEELGGTMTHLHNIGLSWGSAGESEGAYREYIKTKKIISDLKNYIIKEIL